ncbi:N-acetylmuramoyl-L-alanine amidase [Sphingomonas sp.]|uniref:N-acetylmuramoyl-L-alanine amidase n=1 Tax=Sphingomonas sp. TaxID=28214 RepID=UPI000DBBBBD9|nr:N-acetylmuramoyl-L-alanine amidase [Sphingomonas sp.]PZT91670.1 MAG: N-acetylmuramoyl-L-alanine amidase [Sphingomonas sp.]
MTLTGWQFTAQTALSRRIDGIVVHCSATPEGRDVSVATIRSWHRAEGYADIGYHFVIALDGTIQTGRPLAQIGAHVKGYNAQTIGVCYVGGTDAAGKPKDTRTPEQRKALIALLTTLRARFPRATIKGHRDYSPDRNGNGRVDSFEWIKACPSFDAAREYASL